MTCSEPSVRAVFAPFSRQTSHFPAGTFESKPGCLSGTHRPPRGPLVRPTRGGKSGSGTRTPGHVGSLLPPRREGGVIYGPLFGWVTFRIPEDLSPPNPPRRSCRGSCRCGSSEANTTKRRRCPTWYRGLKYVTSGFGVRDRTLT